MYLPDGIKGIAQYLITNEQAQRKQWYIWKSAAAGKGMVLYLNLSTKNGHIIINFKHNGLTLQDTYKINTSVSNRAYF